MSEYPLYKKTFSDTAMYHGATKSASDGRHGSPRRTVRIRLDIGRRLRRCRDRRLSEGPGLGATITDLPNIAPVAETFIAEAGLSDRVSTLAADGAATGCSRSAAARRALHGPGRIFIVESILDVSRASPPLYVGADGGTVGNCDCVRTGIPSAEWLRVTSRSQYQCSIGARHPP